MVVGYTFYSYDVTDWTFGYLHGTTRIGADNCYRDLRESPVPHVTEEWIAADFTLPETLTPEMVNTLKFSDELVDEFLAAERYIFSVPMYNFSIPFNFKAYIDYIVRIGRTFSIENGQFEGLAGGRKILLITTRGIEYSTKLHYFGWDCQEPALRCPFQFIGVTDITFIHANGLDLGDNKQKQGMSEAQAEIQKLVATW